MVMCSNLFNVVFRSGIKKSLLQIKNPNTDPHIIYFKLVTNNITFSCYIKLIIKKKWSFCWTIKRFHNCDHSYSLDITHTYFSYMRSMSLRSTKVLVVFILTEEIYVDHFYKSRSQKVFFFPFDETKIYTLSSVSPTKVIFL